ncbi:hypothetical protein CDAR_598821 [Caerostris darwini]|uniref:Uncharacterized protein n=1 Tax=Caerostris darwini TaxID=1538125 RepID=A0AAV4R3R9_9ARAC|nr:hypothetical protein CDAR_598821 [Caerostris darwini]
MDKSFEEVKMDRALQLYTFALLISYSSENMAQDMIQDKLDLQYDQIFQPTKTLLELKKGYRKTLKKKLREIRGKANIKNFKDLIYFYISNCMTLCQRPTPFTFLLACFFVCGHIKSYGDCDCYLRYHIASLCLVVIQRRLFKTTFDDDEGTGVDSILPKYCTKLNEECTNLALFKEMDDPMLRAKHQILHKDEITDLILELDETDSNVTLDEVEQEYLSTYLNWNDNVDGSEEMEIIEELLLDNSVDDERTEDRARKVCAHCGTLCYKYILSIMD